MRYFSAMRAASMAASKQFAGLYAATMGSGASPWRPYIAMLRSAASVLVGRPVDGPPRWMSTSRSGSSSETARLMVSLFSAHPGPLVVVTPEVAGERRTQRHAGGGDLVLGLHGAHAEVLVLGQLVEDVAGRGDGVAAEEHRQLGQLPGGDEAPRQRDVAGDVGVLAGRQLGGLDLERVVEQLGGLAEGEPGAERGEVARLDEVLELALDPLDGRLGRPRVEPRHQPEREEVLRALGVAWLHAQRLGGLLRERGHRHLDHAVPDERVVVQRVVVVAGLGQVALARTRRC